MDRAKFGAGLVLSGLLLIGSRSGALAQQGASIRNLEVAVERDFSLLGNWLVFRVQESSQAGRDLNGDGDARDPVLHVHHLEKGTTTNLGVAISFYTLSGKWLIFTVSESLQGFQDLNGDGDGEDDVLHLRDLEEGTTTNLEIAASRIRRLGKWLVFEVQEPSQAGRDLNGDGDAEDPVLHLHDLEQGTTTNLGVAISFYTLAGKWLVFTVPESLEGGQDLNGDADSEDDVLYLHDLEDGTTTNLEVAVAGGVSLIRNRLVYQVPESSQGARDLNGDGDARDLVLHLHDLEQNTTTNLEVSITSPGFRFFGNSLFFAVAESSQGGRDLNGDGDAEDAVLHRHDLELGTTTNFELGITRLVPAGRWLIFAVGELSQGGRDLNGDGDGADEVLHLHDPALGTSTNLGLAAARFRLSGKWLVLTVAESSQGGQDLNEDGDGADEVLHLHDLELGITTNLEMSVNFYFVSGRWVILGISEAAHGGRDLNGDGDAEDLVLHLHHLDQGTTNNLEVATGASFSLFLNWLVFQVPESQQGGQDLNEDGDAEDPILHVHDLERGTTTNLKAAVTFPGFRLHVNWLVFAVSESLQGGQDLNGDGDAKDFVPQVADLSTLLARTAFVRGDADSSGEINLTDGIRILSFLFLGQEAPTCRDAADTDDDGVLRLTDSIVIFDWLFQGGAGPRPPGPSTTSYAPADCGEDTTPDGVDPAGDLGCEVLSHVCGA
ncbi:MAG: hypothetical protein O7J95_05100 [Planctomycetota bacterium]|nr:hypothetical protein [Planctomycetota bacterium]